MGLILLDQIGMISNAAEIYFDKIHLDWKSAEIKWNSRLTYFPF